MVNAGRHRFCSIRVSVMFIYGLIKIVLLPLPLKICSIDVLVCAFGDFARDSAFRVALEVMNSENRSYLLVESRQYTECDWQQGQHAAETLLRPLMVPPFIGGVGPACTDAAMSAGRVFVEKNYPLLSFAATSESLSSRSFYPPFFRTV